MINLTDGDLICYRAAASCEPTSSKLVLEPCEIAIWRMHDTVQTIIRGTNCNDFEFYISGDGNFRKEIYPQYKANRTAPPPTWLQQCREVLVTQYNAVLVNGMETDDMLGIRQTYYDGASRIVSLDKDLLQIPGHHWQWEIRGTSVSKKPWVRPATFFNISPLDGAKRFYKQIILGDLTDNVPGFDGKLRNSTPKFIEKLMAPLDDMTSEVDMYNHVLSVYEGNEETLTLHCRLLYILRNEFEHFKKPE